MYNVDLKPLFIKRYLPFKTLSAAGAIELVKVYDATNSLPSFPPTSFQTGETCRRYEGLGRMTKQINPPSDLGAFIKTLNIPDAMTITRHGFVLPPAARDMQPQRMQQVKNRQ
jgi:hypothetical protein